MNIVTFQEGANTIDVLPGPYAPDGAVTAEAREFAKALLAKMNELRHFATSQYLELYNGTWRDDDEPELDAAEFAEQLGEPSITLYDEPGAAMVFFAAGDLFDGHSVAVSIDKHEPQRATLVG